MTPKPLIEVPGAAQVEAGGIPAQVIELPHGGTLSAFLAPPAGSSHTSLVGPPLLIPAGVMLLAIDPDTARKLKAVMRPKAIV